jgi:BCD family chlorophyll transporter-like MFS transporter
MTMSAHPLGWLGIVRLGLVQTALGAIVVLTTSTMNRVMVVELALPAMVPGLLVGLHYAVQLLRPRLGHGSDVGGRRTPWIVGGMAVLALGGVCAAVATAWMGSDRVAGFAFGLLAFTLIGLGVGAAGTSLLVLLAKRVAAERRAAAATIVWIMMIAGFAITATAAGHLLDPFSPARLIAVTAGVGIAAFVLTLVAVRNVEGPMRYAAEHAVDRALAGTAAAGTAPRPAFRAALAQVWAEPQARRFTVFVFVSMLAYSLQDLILEPFAGTVFGLTPGESTRLAGVQHSGVLAGMVVVAVAGSAWAGSRAGALRTWMVGGCIASALALLALAIAGFAGPGWPLRATVFALGLANGAFAVAAIGTMMALAGSGGPSREGIRMGMWGAAQAVAFGLGGFLGTVASDLARELLGAPLLAYATVFACEGVLFLVSATLAIRVGQVHAPDRRAQRPARRSGFLVGIERGRTT